ncbi:dienelactone hydrolase family-domain-containing protein [Lentinula lateritia]|uniref:Dienelactone hydrolase family-domain-containing protein n=1 Tax=Lentinula aff. lateritia TaxID=2804960 RepID=A0ACC1U6Q5_9AGAR|nr:dienelactone hydrolase family-domain-containing protein [Lentinula aff. lateritia]KAJ3854675.1 dienelactone hydrolase family-domain-containing protein [Lentinula lateritia]
MTSTNRVLAGAPGDCCFTGFRHEGTPVGNKITIANVPTYFVEGSSKGDSEARRRILIFLADVYGPFYQNNMLVQDFLAQNGFTVLGIDYFMGDPVHLHDNEQGFDRSKWMEKSHDSAREVFPKWWEAVTAKYVTPRYCRQAHLTVNPGYCFGARYTMQLSDDDAIVAAALAHPAFLNEDHFRNIKKPLMLSCAETDHTFPLQSRRVAEDILVERKAQYFFQVFSGVAHGFASRSDPSSPDGRWGKEQSAHGIALWFHRFIDESFHNGRKEI